MARRIATVSGVALRPGVSRNGRLYTTDMIADAVKEAQPHIQGGHATLVDVTIPPGDVGAEADTLDQRTHHAAEDDSTRIVGRVTSLRVGPNGEALFEADLADTPHGRTIDSLVRPADTTDPDEVAPFLKGVSVRGYWTGAVRTVIHDGRPVERGDGLVLRGLDYTGHPGVSGAEITGYRPAGHHTRESDGRIPIYESVTEGHMDTDTGVEEKGAPALKSGKAAAAPTKASKYADPGYQGDKAPRYALDTKAQAKAAWSFINQTKNATNYTAAQLKRIKGRIKAALVKFGVEVNADESWLIERAPVSTDILEGMSWGMDPDCPASLNVCLDNGVVCITVSSYRVDPHDLDALGRAAMLAACAALDKLDPDMDGDMDVPGAPAGDTDQDMTETADDLTPVIEAHRAPDLEPSDPDSAVSPAPDPAADDETQEEPAMGDTTASETPAATDTTDTVSSKLDALTTAISSLVGRLSAPMAVATETAATAPTVIEATPVATETDEQRIARLVEERFAAQRTTLIQELVEAGQAGAGRKGYVRQVAVAETATADDEYPEGYPHENGQPVAPHKLTPAQWKQFVRPTVEQAVMGGRSVYRQQ